MYKKYISLVAILAALVAVQAFPTGVPVEVCRDMLPRHGADPQKTPMPYTIRVDKNEVSPGDKVKLTITGINGELFKGFMVEALQGDTIVGSFDVSNSNEDAQTIDCPVDGVKREKNALSHTNNDNKSSVNVIYNVPNVSGKITLYATVVEHKTQFWVKQPTAELTIKS